MSLAVVTTPATHHNECRIHDYVRDVMSQIKANGLVWLEEDCQGDLAKYLEEYATVGVHAGRGFAGGQWLIDEFENHSDAIMIVPSEAILGTISKQSPASTSKRLYTADGYMSAVRSGEVKPGFEATFVYNAMNVFNRLNLKTFYRWLAKYVDHRHVVYRLN